MDTQVERLKAKWIAEIDLLIGENVVYATSLLEEIRRDLLEQIRPIKLNEADPQSVIHKRAESFERLCYQMRKNNIPHPEQLSTYSFYATVQIMKTEAEQNQRK